MRNPQIDRTVVRQGDGLDSPTWTAVVLYGPARWFGWNVHCELSRQYPVSAEVEWPCDWLDAWRPTFGTARGLGRWWLRKCGRYVAQVTV